MRISLAFIALVLAACSTPTYIPKSKTTSLRELVEEDWKVVWLANAPTIDVTSTAMLRVATYSSPPFIHRQFLELLSQPQKDLQALCKRQRGTFSYQGTSKPRPPNAGQPLSDSIYQAEANRIGGSASSNFDGMKKAVEQMERANAGLAMRSLLTATSAVPDQLTNDSIAFAIDQKWLGVYSCSNGSEKWMASIFFDGWSNQSKDGATYKAVKITSQLALL